MNDGLEERIRAALQARAEDTVVDATAHPPTRRTGRSRRTGRRPSSVALGVVGLGAAAAAIAAAVVVLRDPDDADRERTVVAGPDGSGAEGSLLGPLPYLVIDLPGLVPTTVEATTEAPSAVDPSTDGWYVQQYETAGGVAGPRVQVVSVPRFDADGSNDIGSRYTEATTQPVTVQGQPARLVVHGRFTGVWWPGGGTGGVLLTASDVSSDAVVALADGLVARTDGPGWDAGPLPDGFALTVDGARGSDGTGPSRRVAMQYRQAVDPGVSLSVSTGGDVAFADRTAPNPVETYEPYEVAGRPAVLVEAGGDFDEYRVLWRPTDTTIAEISAVGSSRDEVFALAVSVRELDEAAWVAALPEDALVPDEQSATLDGLAPGTPLPAGASWDDFDLAGFGVDGPVAGDPVVVGGTRFLTGMVLYAICAWEREWVAAVDADDDERAAAAVAAWSERGSWSLYETLGERMELAGSEVAAADLFDANVGDEDVESVRANLADC